MPEQNECTIATNAALDAALDHCSESDLKRTIAQMVGMEPDVDVSDAPHELDGSACMDMKTVRKWVVRRAVELVQQDNEGVQSAISQAWDEANDACGW